MTKDIPFSRMYSSSPSKSPFPPIDSLTAVRIYDPNKPLPIVFTTPFALSASLHIFQIPYASLSSIQSQRDLAKPSKYNDQTFTSPLTWAEILYIAGFIMREIPIRHSHNLGLFVAAEVLLIAAPPVYELTNYMLLGRTLFYVPYLCIINLLEPFDCVDLIRGKDKETAFWEVLEVGIREVQVEMDSGTCPQIEMVRPNKGGVF